MDVDRMRPAYRRQRNSALKRGIGFTFTFEEWCAWWIKYLGADWRSKRGRGPGKYVMARNGDEGPYSEDNVKCLTFHENLHDAYINGKRSYVTKHPMTAELAVKVFLSVGTHDQVARRFGLTYSQVKEVRCGTTWRAATIGLKKQSAGVPISQYPRTCG